MSLLLETVNVIGTIQPFLQPETAVSVAQDGLAVGGFDIVKFLENLGVYGKKILGGFLTFIGIIGLGWSGFLILKKFFGGQAGQGDSWLKILGLLFFGGALMVGGFSLMELFGKTGKDTIDKIAKASIVSTQVDMITGHFQAGLGLKEFVGIGLK